MHDLLQKKEEKQNQQNAAHVAQTSKTGVAPSWDVLSDHAPCTRQSWWKHGRFGSQCRTVVPSTTYIRRYERSTTSENNSWEEINTNYIKYYKIKKTKTRHLMQVSRRLPWSAKQHVLDRNSEAHTSSLAKDAPDQERWDRFEPTPTAKTTWWPAATRTADGALGLQSLRSHKESKAKETIPAVSSEC